MTNKKDTITLPKRAARALIRRCARLLGLDVRLLQDVIPLDLREIADDPVSASYENTADGYVINVAVRDCIHFLWHHSEAGRSPFVDALLHKTAESTDANELTGIQMLRDWYNNHLVKSFSDVLAGLSVAPNPDWKSIPAIGFVFPWESVDPAERAAVRRRLAVTEGKARGGQITIADGILWWGPIGENKLELEYLSLIRIVKSMRELGYIRSGSVDGDIVVRVLVDKNGTYKYHVQGGHHRIVCVAACGIDVVPVRIHAVDALIRRDEAARWPHVRDGLYSRELALEVFDRCFAGHAPLRTQDK